MLDLSDGPATLDDRQPVQVRGQVRRLDQRQAAQLETPRCRRDPKVASCPLPVHGSMEHPGQATCEDGIVTGVG